MTMNRVTGNLGVTRRTIFIFDTILSVYPKQTRLLRNDTVKSYVFHIEFVEEEDGRWSAGVPTLPGCATWGNTREDALRNLRDAVEVYLRDMKNAGEPVPREAVIEVRDDPVLAITV